MKTFTNAGTALCAIAAALALTACERNDDTRTAGERVDSAVANTQQKTNEMQQDAQREAAQARDSVGRAADTAGDKIQDAVITTAVNAELARDSQLSALRINVDTVSGRVVLQGTAPNEAARERAAMLAARVNGVQSVDNQLSVAPRG